MGVGPGTSGKSGAGEPGEPGDAGMASSDGLRNGPQDECLSASWNGSIYLEVDSEGLEMKRELQRLH